MANQSSVSYGKNALSLKAPPASGENINVFLRPGDQLSSAIDLSKAEYQIVGTDVIAILPNGGKITFVSLGMMAFEENPPIVRLPGGDTFNVAEILNRVDKIVQTPKDSILASGNVIVQNTEENSKNENEAKSEDEIPKDYNAYYVDPQPNIKPQDEIGPKQESGKYLEEPLDFTSTADSVASSTHKADSSETQSKSKDNIADVSAALSFDLAFYQIKAQEDTTSLAPSLKVLGGTGSALGNVSSTPSAQFQAETIDYRDNSQQQVIIADNPQYVSDTFMTKLVRINVSQPVGFGITTITIAGLSNGFQILNSDGTSANGSSGGWSLSKSTGGSSGFSSTLTDGGEIIEFYVKYLTNSSNVVLNQDYLMKATLNSLFDTNNVPASQQATVVTPDLNSLTNFKDIGVIVKDVQSISDYNYTGSYSAGFVLDNKPNVNIIYTGKLDSTVTGGLVTDSIYGSIGDDTLFGENGNDTLSGGAGTNTLDGGTGTADTVSYEFLTKYSDDFLFANSGYSNDNVGVIVDLVSGNGSGSTVYDTTADVTTGESVVSISDTLSNIEYVIGSKYDDTIRGDNAGNKLSGGEGNDTLEGRGGYDWLDGGAGNDWLIGSTDDYMIDGGDNTDTADFSNTSNGLVITLNNSSNGSLGNISGGSASTIIKNVENVAGTQYRDIITGDNSNNLLIGGYDHSAIAVTASGDTITGGAGADTIVGDMMIDSTIGSVLYAENDVLGGGNDNDTIYGDSAPILSNTEVEVAADQSVEYIRNTDDDSTLATIHGGNDTLKGGFGDDYLNGGSGFDTVDFSGSTTPLTVNLSANYASGEGFDQLFNIENIIGSSSVIGDTLIGNNLVNTIIGSAVGGDTLSGLGGNDTLNGGSNAAGKDWADYSYVTSVTGVTVNLTAGTGVVDGTDSDTLISIENVIGSNRADTLTGGGGNVVNTLLGKDGNDIFYGYGDGDTLHGGAGSDTADYQNVSSQLIITLDGSNSDTLLEIENVYGSSNKDTLTGNSDANILDGRGDADTLSGMGGADTLIGGSGNDTLIGGAGNDTLWGGTDAVTDSGIDTADYSGSTAIFVDLANSTVNDGLGGIDTLAGIEVVVGSGYNDVMTGSSSADTLVGNGGNDTFNASFGSDTYYGGIFGSGNDGGVKDRITYAALYGQSSVDRIVVDLSSGVSANIMAGGSTIATDSLYAIEEIVATSGDDTLIGGSGAQTFYGGAGNDTLTGNIDGDYLDGEGGINLADYSGRSSNLVINLAAASNNAYVSGATTPADTLSNIQNITTGSGADTISGNSSDNIVHAGSANDIINGGEGNDTLFGEEGNDTFVGGEGDDTLIGGTSTVADSGIDTADYSGTLYFGVNVDLSSGTASGSTIGSDLLYGIENVIGSAQADTLKGGTGVNTLSGLGGNDTLYGNLDGDRLDGGIGINTADYSTSNAMVANLGTGEAYLVATPATKDSLILIQNVTSGSGNDTLTGASGTVNTLSANGGDDTLIGNLDGDSLIGGSGIDTMNYGAANTSLTVDMGVETIAMTSTPASKDYFAGVEVITTGAYNDRFTFSTASDTTAMTLDGGNGVDTIDYGTLLEAISVTLNGATNAVVTVGASGGNDDLIRNIENVSGSKVADTITGDSLSNVIMGNEGDDILNGGSGVDSVYGGADNDTIIGTLDGAGDFYYGDAGIDTIDYATDTNNITLTSGTTAQSSGIGSDLLTAIEVFNSGSGADTLTGGSSSITIYGNLGADVITGSSVADLLYGDNATNSHTAADGHNIIAGGAGNDTLYAGGNGDSLRGDAGNDTIYGGAGTDTLDYVTNNIAITANLATGIINGDGSDIVDTASIEILRSGTGADNITGADTGVLSQIYAGGGADVINGGSLAETLYGEAGNDTLRGGLGIDTLYGGDGNDTIFGAIDGDTVFGGNNSDTLDFSDISSATNLIIDMINGTVNTTGSTFSEIENITGGDGNDQIIGDANANTLKGGAGNDTIFTSDGIDFIDGGSGTADVIDFSTITTAAVSVNLSTLQILNDGYGNAETVQNIEIINGGNATGAGDTLYGDGMANTIYGNAGADNIKGGDGADILYGDNTTNSHAAASDTINGEAGNDTLYGSSGNDTLDGGLDDDLLDGQEGSDLLYGSGGNDTFNDSGTTGTDTVSYGTSTKRVVAFVDSGGQIEITDGTLSGLAASPSISGATLTNVGTDTIVGGIEAYIGSGYADDFFATLISGSLTARPTDTLIVNGGGGNDTIYGGTQADTLSGDDNDDTISGFAGADVLSGGNGWDSVSYLYDPAGVRVNLGGVASAYGQLSGSATDGWGNTDTLSTFERVLGSNLADTITGGSGTDDLRGNGGDDWIVMTSGNDAVYGGETTETGGDTIDYFYATTAGVVVNLSTSSSVGADFGTDTVYEIENVSGSLYVDTITGDSSANRLIGRTGNDTISGGAGADVIYGDDNSAAAVDGIETGNDSLLGDAGADTLYGGLGNDSLFGGADNDTLYGGSGADYLNGGSGTNTLLGNDGNDTFELADATATNTITGGNDTDTLYFDNAGSSVVLDISNTSSSQSSGGGGTIRLIDLIENVTGSDHNDTLTGNSAANVISAGQGADLIYGSGGIDTIYGGSGNDRIYADIAAPSISDGGNTIYGGEGADTIWGSLGADTIDGDDGGSYGTNSDDTIFAISSSDGSDVINGGQGYDTADYSAINSAIKVTLNTSTAATVTITGGDNDTIRNVENFIGGSGNDTITGDSAINYLNGGAGNDTLFGMGGADILTDTSGINTFVGGAGNDTISGTGNAGNSWLDYSLDGINEGAYTDLTYGLIQNVSTNRGSDLITAIDNITGSAYNDVFYGNNNVNTILGGDGNDTIEGYGGNDTLDGGAGTSDTLRYYHENKINVTLADGGADTTVQVWNGSNWTAHNDLIRNFENIEGSNSSSSSLNSDTISGNSSNNTIWGYAGNDSLYGGGGADYIDGGSDNDTIAGGDGADIIYGGNGNDVIRANATSYTGTNTGDGDHDTVFGGAGQDFIYGAMDGDTLYGNDASTVDGSDWLRYNEYAGGVIVDITANTARDATNASLSDIIYGFTHVLASSSNDNTVYGNTSNNSIIFGSGNDEYYASNLASNTTNYGSDIVDMASGNDDIYFHVAELTSGDTINGGDGTDTLFIRDTGILANAQFSNVSNVEIIQLSSTGSNNITLDKNDVTIIGGALDDVFNYALSSFDSHDTINGSGGNDTLVFTSAGTLTSAMLSSVSNFEKIQLANGTNNITVDISTISGASLVGGTGADTFNYSIANLSSADSIDGGLGTDTLAFLDAGTINDSQFTSLSSIEKVQLYAGTNTFNIGANESTLSGVSLIGTTGVDTFVYTASALTDGTANASIIGASSNDVLKITGSNGSDAVIDANLSRFSGINTLDLTSYTGSGASVTLGSNATTMGLATINASSNSNVLTIDASSMSSAVTINAGSALDTLRGGSGADVINITAAKAIIDGNGGSDVLNINGAITQDGSLISEIETINVNANTSITNTLSGVSAMSVASGQMLSMDASLISGDTMSIANSGTVVLNNADSNTFSTITMTGSGALRVNGDNDNASINLSTLGVTGYSGTITITGGAGDDVLTGTARADTLYGGSGNDTLLGGSGTDYLDGGADDDTYRFSAAGDISSDVVNDTGGGTDLIWADFNAATVDFSGITATGIEGLKFYQAATVQTLSISRAQAAMYTDFVGFAGASDIVNVTNVTSSLDMNSGKTYTNVSKVIVNGSGGTAMTLTGAANVSNSITGGNGADVIVAGQLADTLAGGSGNDTFQFISGYLNNSDIVSDSSGTADVMHITDSGATISDTMLTNVTNVEVLKLSGGTNSVTLGAEANNGGAGFTTVDLSTGGTNTINNSSINNLRVTGGAGSDTLNLSSGVALNGSNITNVEAINITSGSTAISGTFAGTPTLNIAAGASATTTTTASISAETYVINGTLTSIGVNGADLSGFTLNSGGTANLTLSAGGSLNASTLASKDSGGVLKIYGSTGNESITIDTAKFATNTGDTITDSAGTDTLIVTGNSALDFTKISGMEIVDLTGYSFSGALTTSNGTGETVKIDSTYTSINLGGTGTDILQITANSVDLSGATLIGIESFQVDSGATLTIKASDIDGKTLSGAGNVVVIVSAASAASFAGITATGTKTLEFTANATFTGTLGNISVITVDGGVSATMSAASLNGKTATISGTGTLDITANTTAANNNFSGLTNSITGDVTLNVTSILDLSGVTLGTVLDKVNTSAALTLSGAQANALGAYAGAGNITIAAGTASVDLSTKVLTGYSGTFTINDGSGVQTLTGTANADTFNLDNASASVVAGGGDDTIAILSTMASSPTGTIDGGAGSNDILNIAKSGLSINASNITGVETINVNASTTLTGTLSATSVVVAAGVILTADASVLSGKNISGSGTVNVTNLEGTPAADFTNVTVTTVNATWSSGIGTYTGNLVNVDTLIISGGTMTIDDSILGTTVVNGSGNLTVNADDTSMSLTNVNISGTLTINDGTGVQALTGSANADLFNLDNNDATSNGSGGGDTYNVSDATNINDTGASGTDILNITADSIDLSGKTISGIETLALGATTGTTLNAAEASSMNITGSAANAFTISGSGGADSVNLSSDLGSFSGSFSFNGGAGNDSMTLDFSKLSTLTMDGGADTDTLALSAITSGSTIDATGFNNISNIEVLDVSSLATGNALNINFSALDFIATSSNSIDLIHNDTATTNLTGATLEVYASTDTLHTTNLASSGSWTLSNVNANFDIINNGSDAFTLHVLTV
jgi:Ca2+-binding RTX toxin-like protein